MSKRKPFSDRLTPKQIQHVFDALGFTWREYYDPDNNGWVNLPKDHKYNSLSINIYHGGFKEQSGDEGSKPASGDIVTLVKLLRFGLNDEDKAIAWITEELGTAGSTPPELEGGFGFAKDWLKDKNHNYTRIPNEILFSNSLTASEKIVWGAIFERCNGEDIYSIAGIRRISKRLNLAIGTVQKAINKLEQLNLLIVKYRGKNVAPQKFPLVADKEIINKAKSTVSNSEQQKKGAYNFKSAVSNSEQGCSSIDTATVSNSELNNSHKQKPLEQEPNSHKSKIEKTRSMTSVFDDSLNAEKRKTVKPASPLIALFLKGGIEPPPGYSSLFRATFKTTAREYEQILNLN